MRILVAVASRHGSTAEIAAAIAEELTAAGHTVDVRDVRTAGDPAPYGAVVLGSAVYMGSWLPEATAFVEEHADRLHAVPVWLFSSGPLGADPPQPAGEPNMLGELVEETGAVEHRLFVGRLDKHALGLGERAVAGLVHAPAGDFRDWAAIRAWARAIAAALAG